MKTRFLLLLLFFMVHAVSSHFRLMAAPLRFEGGLRACAGGVDDDIHQLKLTVRGLEPNETVSFRFEGVTLRDNKGRPLLPPRFWNGKEWTPTLTTRTDREGVVPLRILSGQAVEKPRLVAMAGDKVLGQVECDFDAPEMLRRFPEPGLDNEGQWSLPDSDNGYLFDYGLAMTGKRENGKVYLKFRLNPKRGDVDGNWSVVNGHRMKVRVSEIAFNANVFRSDGAKVYSLTDEKDTSQYMYVHDPQDPTAKTTVVTTSNDGSASFVIVAGPKYDLQTDNYPQHFIEARDITVYEPPPKTPLFTVKPVSAQGALVEWTNAASELRGKLLLGSKEHNPQKDQWKIIDFDAKGRHETSFAIGKWTGQGFSLGSPFWSPDGSRFGLTAFGTGNDYMMTFGLFNAQNQTLINTIEPPYVSWKQFSPDAKKLAFIRGSTQVVGSSRVDDDYTLRVWNGATEFQMPVDKTFLASDDAGAMVCWRTPDELLVTQVTYRQNTSTPQKKGLSPKGLNPKATPEPSPTPQDDSPSLSKSKRSFTILSVDADGKNRPKPVLSRAWRPLSSPDGRLIAFYGPESPRQKPTQYYAYAPLDQSLCLAQSDGQPMRSGETGHADRLPLGRFGNSYPALFWSPDSKTLYAVSVIAEGTQPFVDIWAFEAHSGERRRVATWDYQYPKRTVSNDSSSYSWSFSGLSADGKTLYATYTQLERNPKEFFMLRTQQWFGVSLSTGKVSKLATIRGTDFAWHSDEK